MDLLLQNEMQSEMFWSESMMNENREQTDRSYRHKINERTRRKKERQGYMALRSMLPPRTKNDKNSIVQTATLNLREMQSIKEELQRRNEELEAKLAANEGENVGTTKIKLRVVNPSSAADSMIEVLSCLKRMGLKARIIRSQFSAQEFSAALEIETQIEASEVEEAVKRALAEVERKLGHTEDTVW